MGGRVKLLVGGPDTLQLQTSLTNEACREDGPVATVESHAHCVPYFLGVPTSRAGALWALEALGLLLEENAAEDIRVVDVPAVRADPLALPVAFFFRKRSAVLFFLKE